MRYALAAILLAPLAGCSTASTGLFRTADGAVLELHVGHDRQIRGYLREGSRVAALSSVAAGGGRVKAAAVYDDGSRAEITKTVRLVHRERAASPEVQREIEDAYARLVRAVETKDYDAFQALRVADFATIPPDGIPSPAARMADRARGMLERIQPPIRTSNEILRLTTRGGEAIATVRQRFTRQQIVEGQSHTVHNEVTQRETWRKTDEGWKLVFVDEVRDPLRMLDGQRVQ